MVYRQLVNLLSSALHHRQTSFVEATQAYILQLAPVVFLPANRVADFQG